MVTQMKFETRIVDQEGSQEYDQILAELRKYNRSHVEKDQKALTIVVHDDKGAIAAGLNGATYFGWLFIEHLWVREDCRKEGFGKKLVTMAEAQAQKRGCRHVYLDTFSFQAPDFYKKMGYSEYAKFDDFPGKHSRYFFKKDLI
jgi:N-acetylglutamate synthase-like GNAT family acetyltransferase